MLIKRVYTGGEKKEWKIWYFHDDLPLVSDMIQVEAFDII